MEISEYLDISSKIKDAQRENKPIVALESTIISHGMPYPQNVQTALKMEKTVEENGAIPATIAIIRGKMKVGLTKEEIDYLGRQGENVTKVSRRDIPVILAEKKDGATTVASTMIIANMANIKVFATGGIGGVHRNACETFDISADLQELSKTNIAVVCAGPKSILDIGLTLEYLETHGIPVLGYKTEELPAFYTRQSGFKVDYNITTTEAIAKIIKIKNDIGLKGGIVIANPIEKKHQLEYEIISQAIEKAVNEAGKLGIKGKETTPYLLSKVKEITGGKSLESNIKLVLNNGKIAAQIACHLYKH